MCKDHKCMCKQHVVMFSIKIIPSNNIYGYHTSGFSSFEKNKGGRAGVLSVAYLHVSFRGTNVFKNNTGRVLVVSPTLN